MRAPDWLIYAGVVALLIGLSLHERENADAPPPPDPEQGPVLGPVTPFDPSVTVNAPDIPFQPASGTAFSVDGDGRWLTARHVVEGCRQPALEVGGGRAVAADVRLAAKADLAMLITDGGPAALRLGVGRTLRRGQVGFHPGYPQGRAGEVATRLLGRETLDVRGRGARREPVLAWAEVGRTRGLKGGLAGLSGAPALDRAGRVVAVTIAEAPRRGRLYTTAPETLGPAVAGVQGVAARRARPLDIDLDSYGAASDALRATLSVARVVCLSA